MLRRRAGYVSVESCNVSLMVLVQADDETRTAMDSWWNPPRASGKGRKMDSTAAGAPDALYPGPTANSSPCPRGEVFFLEVLLRVSELRVANLAVAKRSFNVKTKRPDAGRSA